MDLRWIGGLVAGWLFLTVAAAQQAPTLEQIRDCARQNMPQTLRIQKIRLKAFDRAGGSREMRGRLYGMREDDGRLRLTLRIDVPPDLSGAAYLVREEPEGQQVYVYLPALNRVRRVTGASMGGSLFATDFSYNEMTQIHGAFDADSAELEGPGEVSGRVVDWISVELDRSQQETGYERVRAAVDRESCVPLQIEFYEHGEIAKRYTADGGRLRQVDGLWYAEHAEMRDLRQGTHTELLIEDPIFGDELSDRYFTPMTFHEGT